MKSKIKKWIPSDSVNASIYTMRSITDNFDGFSVVLENKVYEVLTIKWDAVESYCCSTEEVRFKFVATEWQQIKRDFPNWFFFKIIDSPYINWIHEQSGGFISKEKLKHFMIVTTDFVLDVVSRCEPCECIKN